MMAIRRCPYCKAIIEEGAEYCSNCGTQLLFPEDELIEEEIPGEKVIEDESDEEINTPEEVIEEIPPSDEIPDTPGMEKAEGLPKEDKKEEPEEIPRSGEPKTDPEVGDKESAEQKKEQKGKVDDFQVEEQEAEPLPGEKAPLPLEEEEQGSVQEESAVLKDSRNGSLKMEDLEKAIDFEEIEKREIEKFLGSIKKDRRRVDEPSPEEKEITAEKDEEEFFPLTPIISAEADEERLEDQPDKTEPESDESFQEKDLKDELVDDSPQPTPGPQLFEMQDLKPATDDMPAWASRIEKEDAESLQPGEDVSPSVTPSMDTTRGLPEVFIQKDLPFGEEDDEAVTEKKERKKKPPSGMTDWMKSRTFDVLFIAAVWLITLWIASYVMEVSFFRLFTVTAIPLVAFYVILLTGYFFLFFYFLGETLGDHLFNSRHRSEPHHPA
jgi:hypothetical protein